jgi:hypothetical protein
MQELAKSETLFTILKTLTKSQLVYHHGMYHHGIWYHEKVDEWSEANEWYLCDTNGIVVQVSKRYVGNFSDYKDSVITMFGKTPHKINDNVVTYTFPKVCVKIVINEYNFWIHVIDRQWLENELADTLREYIRILEWCVKALEKNQNMTEKNYATLLPPLFSTKMEYNPEKGNVIYSLNNKLYGKSTPVVASVNAIGLDIFTIVCPNIPKLGIQYQNMGMENLYHSAYVYGNEITNIRPLFETHWSDLERIVVLNLVQIFFPPIDGKYTEITQKTIIGAFEDLIIYNHDKNIPTATWSSDKWNITLLGCAYLSFSRIPKKGL